MAMSKEVELETFGHECVLEERDLCFLEERERKLGECTRRVGGTSF